VAPSARRWPRIHVVEHGVEPARRLVDERVFLLKAYDWPANNLVRCVPSRRARESDERASGVPTTVGVGRVDVVRRAEMLELHEGRSSVFRVLWPTVSWSKKRAFSRATQKEMQEDDDN
jgi:hypothetical protein